VAIVMNLAHSASGHCSDPDPQVLTYRIGTNGTKGTATIDAAGTWTYTPNANTTGSDSFTVVANDSITDSVPALISVTITNHFDPRNDGFTVVAVSGTQLDVLANDAGGSGQPLTITSVTQGSLGLVTTDGHTVTYEPRGCGLGTDVFTYSVTDGIVAPVTKSVFVTVAKPGTSGLPLTPVTDAPSVGLTVNTAIGSTGTVPVRVNWCGVVGTALRSYGMSESRNAGASFGAAYAGATPATNRPLVPGYHYAWKGSTTDTSGRTGTSAASPTVTAAVVQDRSSSVALGGSWSLARSSNYSGGTESYSTRTSAYALIRVSGARMFGIVSSKAIGRGSLRVYVNNRLVATISERASGAQYRQVIYVLPLSPGGSYTITVRPAGNGRVDLDGFITLK